MLGKWGMHMPGKPKNGYDTWGDTVVGGKLTCQTDYLYSHTDYSENGEALHWGGSIENLPNHIQKFSRPKGVCRPSHYHLNVELIFIIEGSGLYTIDQQDYAAGAGDLVIFNSGQTHAVTYQEDIVFFHMILDPAFTDDFGFSISDIVFENVVCSPTVQRLAGEINRELDGEPLFYEHKMDALLQILVTELLRSHIHNIENAMKDGSFTGIILVKEVIRYLSKNFDHKITLDEIAEAVCFNKSYIARTFKRITKHTIWEYLNLMRCRFANQLLSQTGDSIEEIANLCGFGNVPYFRKVYKEFMDGRTPTEYRRRTHLGGKVEQ